MIPCAHKKGGQKITAYRFDSIIIGGGLAGLTCAAYLARAGKKVAVFQQHPRPGGYCTSFSRKGITFNPGPYWINGADEINSILKELNVRPLQFSPLNSLFRIIGPGEGTNILLTKDRETFESTILRSFPEAKKESINKLIGLSLEIEKEISQIPSKSPEMMSVFSRILFGIQMAFRLRKTIKYGRMTTEELLESLFPEEELRSLVAALHSTVSVHDFPASAFLGLMATGLKGKAFIIDGGAQKTADAFEEAVIKNGGEIFYSKKVSKIKIQNRRAVGVMLEDGTEFESENVVSAIDAKQTFNRLIDPDLLPSKFKKKIDNTPVSESAFTVSIVTDIDPSGFGFDDADVFVNSSFELEEMFSPDDPEKITFRLSFPTLIDPSCRAERVDTSIHGIQIQTLVPFEFENYWRAGPELQRGDEYQEFKELFASILIKRVEKHIPGLGEHILYLDIATPITYYRYTLNHHGAIVGWREFGPWKQKVPFIQGLYLAGHWVGGKFVHGAISSGKTAAELILRNE